MDSIHPSTIQERSATSPDEAVARRGSVPRLSELSDQQAELLDMLPTPVLVSVSGALVYANPALLALIGASGLDEVQGGFGDRVLTAESLARLRSLVEASRINGRPVSDETSISTFAGSVLPVRIAVRGIQVGETTGSIMVIQDRSRDVARHRELETLAHIDPMTGLLRRETFLDELDRAVSRSTRSGRPLAVLYCDLNGLKEINDTYGHHVGDELIGAAAGRLRGALRPGDYIGRIGGDEFAILCEGVDEEAAEGLATRMWRAVKGPLHSHGVAVDVDMSIGGAVAAGTWDTRYLIESADGAMYAAKRSGDASVVVKNLGSNFSA